MSSGLTQKHFSLAWHLKTTGAYQCLTNLVRTRAPCKLLALASSRSHRNHRNVISSADKERSFFGRALYGIYKKDQQTSVFDIVLGVCPSWLGKLLRFLEFWDAAQKAAEETWCPKERVHCWNLSKTLKALCHCPDSLPRCVFWSRFLWQHFLWFLCEFRAWQNLTDEQAGRIVERVESAVPVTMVILSWEMMNIMSYHESAHIYNGHGVMSLWLSAGGDEGRGIGLVEKIRAYELQESGHVTTTLGTLDTLATLATAVAWSCSSH